MITDNKEITTPSYWEKVYTGQNDGAVDNSNTKRPAKSFDRFSWLADQVDGPKVLDVASGHAHTCKIIHSRHKDWVVVASDQTPAAKEAAKYHPYLIMDAYRIPYPDKEFTTVTISQALEYLEHPDRFMWEAMRVAEYFVCTVPDGIMEKWSQLREYDEAGFKSWLEKFGKILHFDKAPGLMLAKIKFHQ